MKLLYFPGLISIIDNSYDLATSCKLIHLHDICDCTVFDYKTFDPEETIRYIKGFDVLFGSSFGGFYAFFLSLVTGQKCISINPSLYLDKRFSLLSQQYPDKLAFIKQEHLTALVKEPVREENKNIHVLMNLDDEKLSAEKVLSIAEKYCCNIYTFEKGGHDSSNFIGEMLPLIKQLLIDNK